MDFDPKFKDLSARKLWDDYFYRVKRSVRHLNKELSSELEMELKSHLYESFNEREGENEIERLIGSMEDLGKPEEYMKSAASDKVLSTGKNYLNPRNMILGMFYSSLSTFKLSLMIIPFGIGYSISFLMAMVSFIKIFWPQNAGVFMKPGNDLTVGITTESMAPARDVLGLWTIPVFLVLSIALYFGLSTLLKKILKS